MFEKSSDAFVAAQIEKERLEYERKQREEAARGTAAAQIARIWARGGTKGRRQRAPVAARCTGGRSATMPAHARV